METTISIQDIYNELSEIKKLLMGTPLVTDEYLNSSDFMRKAEIGRTKMHELMREGKVKATKKGGRLYFHRSELDKLFINA